MTLNDSHFEAILRASNYHRKASQIELAPVRGGNQAAAMAGEMSRLDASLSGNSGPSLQRTLAQCRTIRRYQNVGVALRHFKSANEQTFEIVLDPETFFLPESVKKSGGRG
jgi:hypothetical protein